MSGDRVVGVHLEPAKYKEILEANYVDAFLKKPEDGDPVLFKYSGTSTKQAPRWAEILICRHLLQALLVASLGRGILQSSWTPALAAFMQGKCALADSVVEGGAYNIRLMIMQLREYKRSHSAPPKKFAATLQTLFDWAIVVSPPLADDPSLASPSRVPPATDAAVVPVPPVSGIDVVASQPSVCTVSDSEPLPSLSDSDISSYGFSLAMFLATTRIKLSRLSH